MERVPVSDPPEVLERFHGDLDLVEIIARQLMRSLRGPADFDDLVSAGREGLWEAARRYDQGAGVPFRSFANLRVRGAMLDHLRRMSTLPRRAYERLVAMEAAHLVSEGQAERSLAETAPPMSPAEAEKAIDEHLLAMLTAAAVRMVGASAHAETEEATSNPERAYEKAELRAAIRAEVDRLSPEEAEIVRRFYFEEHGLGAIAEDLDVSKSWASRIHTRAINRLSVRLRKFAESGSSGSRR